MLWIFAARFFMAALRQCEKSEGCFAVFTAQPWTAAVLFKLQFSDGLLAPSTGASHCGNTLLFSLPPWRHPPRRGTVEKIRPRQRARLEADLFPRSLQQVSDSPPSSLSPPWFPELTHDSVGRVS